MAVGLFGVLAGCAGSPDDGTTTTDVTDQELSTQNLLFEGTCDFLHDCSTYSRKLPAGEVSWGCDGVMVCDETDHWMAGPSRKYCGKTMKICRGDQCTTGIVRDVSDVHGWEANGAILDDLDLPHGLTSTCGGYGGGKVSIQIAK